MSEDRAHGECALGVTKDELESILVDRLPAFYRWHEGLMVGDCNGLRMDYETETYEDSGCGPHGPVVYRWDLERFLSGRQVVDW